MVQLEADVGLFRRLNLPVQAEILPFRRCRSFPIKALIHIETGHDDGKCFGLATLTINKSELALMKETKELLDELLETLDVLADKKLLRDIEISRSQASKGQIRNFRTFMEELGVEPHVHRRSNSKVRKSLSKA